MLADDLKNISQKNKSYMSIKAIDQLKESISKINPNKIISEALTLANKKFVENNKKKFENLEQTRKNAIDSFLLEIENSDKNIDQLRLISTKKLNEYKSATDLIVERSEKETKEYISKLDGINKDNQMLQKRYLDMKSQFIDLQIKQKNSLNQIEQMKKSEKILTINKPIFNDFLKQFKEQSPKQIIQDIEKQKEGFKFLTGEYNSTINKIIFNKKIHDIKIEKEEKKISEITNKIHEIEDENALIQQNFGNAVEDLQKEIKELQGLKEDNDKFRKMLYQLYNRLIGAFSLDKDINLKKKLLNLKKEDYKPNLLDDNEIFKYIKLMISSMNRSTSDQLLRETIAYSNMITRVYLKNKINLKYEPYSTFKELKDIMEKNEEKIFKLTNIAKEYEEKLNIMSSENKKLNKIINYFHQEKNKNIENKQNIMNSNFRNSLKLRKLNRKEKHSKEYSSPSQSSSTNLQNKMFRINSANPSYHKMINIRGKNLNDKDNTKEQKSLSKTLLAMKKSSSLIDHKNNNKLILDNIDSKLLKNPLYQSIQSMICNKLINKYYGIVEKNKKENRKDNYYSKANEQNIVTYLNEFKQLINHTNRLFLYKAKMSPNLYLAKNRNLSSNKLKFNRLIKMKKMNNSTGNLLQDFVSSKIISKINGIINNLQYKDDDNDKNNLDLK